MGYRLTEANDTVVPQALAKDWMKKKESDWKDTNPKDTIGTTKLPMSLVPSSLTAYASLAFLEGMLKYGLVNWRESGIRASIYLDAMQRHIAKYISGEWEDPTTRVPHLASVIACCGIILDASLCGKLVDDRPRVSPVPQLIDSLSEVVEHLKALHKDKTPTHYTQEHDNG